MQLGMLTILPANFQMLQWQPQGRLEEALFVETNLSARLEGNTGQYRRPMSREKGNPASATQVNYDAIKEASLGKGAVNRFYAQLDNLGEEIYKRATNFNLVPENNGRGPNAAAVRFQQKCLEAGVPKSCLKKIRFVRATRNSGNGSVFLRQQVVSQTSQLVPMMNEQGKQAWLDDAIAVMAGTENVARWNPKKQLDPSMQNDQAMAMIENDVIKDGSPVMITSTQNAMVHAMTHMKAATEAVNSIPQGGDPRQVLMFLESVGPHIAQHLQSMAGDQMRGNELRILGQQLKQLGTVTDQIKRQMEQAQKKQMAQMQRQQEMMAQQRQRTQQVLTDEQLKQLETQNKLQLSREKADTNMQLRREVHDQRQAIQLAETQQRLTISDATAATDIRNKTAKTAADVAAKKAKDSAAEEKV